MKILFKEDVEALRNQYNQEYKDYVAKLVVDEGRKGSELVYELEISYSTMRKGVANYKETKDKKPGEQYLTPNELEKERKEHEKEVY
ncbi:transposase [Salibacterium salarium]|uniref:Transposase n=1 Tax=Salibacterium salarium TaxID=284579 RepID=A0A3R9Q6J0_9BACI|nr:transposase [Salibacterium salarium]RSL34707.1 transposase [Salibacterium salarium]